MAKSPKLIVKIGADSRFFSKELDKVEREALKSAKFLDGLDSKSKIIFTAREKRLQELRMRNNRILKRAALALAAVAAVGTATSIRNFAEFEQGLAGVSKTTNIVGKDLEKLGEDITAISIATGVSSDLLLTLAQSVGQMGITGTENIVKFTKAMANLEKTTNITGEAGAIAVSQLLGLTNEDTFNIDRISSVIVDLGNNFATLETNIVFTASEIAGAGSIFGISATQALSLAAAFSELKVPPELARTAITLSMGGIRDAIRGGGEEMEILQAVTGQTAEQLKESFGKDATIVFQQFIDGLAEMEKQNISTDVALKAFNLNGLRMKPTFQKLATGSDTVREALEQGKIAYEENKAAQKELATQLNTTNGRLGQTKQAWAAASREIGEEFTPVVDEGTRLLKDLTPIIRDGVVPVLQLLLGTVSLLVSGFDGIGKAIRFITIKVTEFGIATVGVLKSVTDSMDSFVNEKSKKLIKLVVDTEVKEPKKPKDKGLDIEAANADFDNFLVNLKKKNQAKRDAEAEEKDIITASEDEKNEVVKTKRTELQKFFDNLKDNEKTKEEEEREAKLEREQEEFDQDLETLEERLAEKSMVEDVFAGQDIIRDLDLLKSRAKTAKEEEVIDKNLRDAQEKFSTEAVKTQILNLDQLFGAETAVGKAIFLVRKAQLIAETISSTQASMALARATVPPPAGDVIATRYAIAGALNVAVIAGTAIQGAVDGTVVSNGVLGRDTEPYLLAKNEIVLPSKANPLSSDFDETFGQGGLGGSQNVNVQIGLDENASRVLTVKQREDTALGIQR